MKRIAMLFTLPCLVVGTVLEAEETPRQIIDRCFAASSSGDSEGVQSAAIELKKLGFIADNRDRVDAAYCLRTAHDEPWVYSEDLNRMIPSRLREEIIKTSDALDKAKEDHSVLNANRIRTDVYQACVTLYEDELVAAMTKQLCIDSFAQQGHPALPSRSDYVSGKLEAELRDLDQEDRDIILDALVSD